MARLVLNKCTVADPDIKDDEDHKFQVLYNYEFIEDFEDGIKADER